ncbi:MAG TPA: phytanoyl-CoA dioxygenase family protein [Planctomicrobium sp.]|nr:phytanoyl-CoA dioxygenase family protein [Planctomicrobium sp.]
MQQIETHSNFNLFESRGWLLLEKVYAATQVQQLCQLLTALSQSPAEAVRQREGAVYAARNVLELCPEILNEWQTQRLKLFIQQVLGPQAGLVRALYFDKPPEQTWALPWHKDLLIAVANDLHAFGYSKPRLRVGTFHTEPPVTVLEQMLTLRIHLDAMTPDNGPLEVLTGSHVTGKQLIVQDFKPTTITSAAGDVLAMRPLLVHSSGRSKPDCDQHRRVLHLEFCGIPNLPEEVIWQNFHPIL